MSAENLPILETHSELVALQGELSALWGQAEQTKPSFEITKTPRHERIFQAVLDLTIDDQTQQSDQRSLEEGANNTWAEEEEYSHSTRMIAIVGNLAVKGQLQTKEGILAKETLRERYESSVIEMLHTDQEFREKLEINRERRHVIKNGRIMALDGKTEIVGITERGALSAGKAAETNPAMAPVAARCGADERVAKRVEKLPIGGLMVGLSVDPKEAMSRYGKKFYEDKGFREGLAFIQWYYRVDENTLLAATYSVDNSDITAWREVWAEFGGNIPEGEVTDTWLDHDITKVCTENEARELVRQIRGRFYEKQGIVTTRYSVDEFMAINQAVCDTMFETLYMKLPIAYQTHVLGVALKSFVDGLLNYAADLKENVRTHLATMRRSEKLVRADIALLEQLVRYAVTERLRTGLELLGTTYLPRIENFVIPEGVNPAQFIALGAAANVITGARAGRTYGGCTKSIDLANDPLRPQDAFGGRDLSEAEREAQDDDEDDGLGPRKFKCTEGHINTRPKGKLLTECQTKPCKEGSVGCEPKHAKRSSKKEKTRRPVTPRIPNFSSKKKAKPAKSLTRT